MADIYTTEEKKKIDSALKMLWEKMNKTYRLRSFAKIASKVGAQPATVWRWHKGKATPSRWHYVQIRKFLGFGDRW